MTTEQKNVRVYREPALCKHPFLYDDTPLSFYAHITEQQTEATQDPQKLVKIIERKKRTVEKSIIRLRDASAIGLAPASLNFFYGSPLSLFASLSTTVFFELCAQLEEKNLKKQKIALKPIEKALRAKWLLCKTD